MSIVTTLFSAFFNTKRTLGVGVFILLATLFLDASPARAVEQCSALGNTFSAAINLTPDTYTAYVKLGASGQTSRVEVATTSGAQGCAAIGQVDATFDTWQLVGQVSAAGTASTIFTLSSNDLSNTGDYSRPQLLLISSTNPACVPSTECFTTIQGEQAALQPPSDTLDAGTLRIFALPSVADQPIKEVRYYVDGTYMYTTPTLETFDPQAIPYSAKTISRTVEYENGQTAVLETTLTSVADDSLAALLARTLRRYQNLLIWGAVLAGLFLIYHIVRHILTAYEQRHEWLYAHGYIKEKPHATSPSYLARVYTLDRVRRVFSGIGVVALIALVSVGLIVLSDSYVARIVAVSGDSMRTTLEDGQRIVINRIPATLANINKSDPAVERGQIIAAYANSRFDRTTERNDDDVIIKRIIGLPGERIVIQGSVVTIYNAAHPEGFNPEGEMSWYANVIPDTEPRAIDVKLSTSEVFIMGDNRPVSIDSRQNGPLELGNIIGTALGIK